MNEKDYICISDIAKAKSDKSRAADVIRNWLRNRSTLVECIQNWANMVEHMLIKILHLNLLQLYRKKQKWKRKIIKKK